MRRQILISSLILLFAAAFAIADDLSYKPGELLVRFADPATSTQTKNSILSSILGCACSPVVKEYSIVPGLTLIELPSGTTVEQARASLSHSPYILYTGPNYKVKANVIPNDPRFSDLWAMNNTGQSGGVVDADIDAPEAWDMYTGSSSIVVAVADTGVDYTHPDLMANRWVNTGEIPGNGLDDDDNGYIDDVYGYDFVNGDGDPMDDHEHGTHVSGIIGAVGNNGLGVVGVCWTVKIMALKVLDEEGSGEFGEIISGIQYAVANGARVINASWGGYFSQQDSQGLYDAISAARSAGVIFVAAAGNDSLDNDATLPPHNPSSYNLDNIIAVMATTNTDVRASFSNYGFTTVDLGAPGFNILSTIPGGSYGFRSGTSMAAPHITGACALLLSADPNLTYTEVKGYLMDYSDPLPSLTSFCVSGGRLNLFNAVSEVIEEVIYDTIPPSPDPAEWEIDPQATGLHTIGMQAKKATDRSGVEYFFECVTDANFNSTWQSSPQYVRGDYAEGTMYSFRVKYRDKSENHNETEWSAEKSDTTASADNLPPFPNPSRWNVKPSVHRLLPTPQVRMSAMISTDDSSPVEYYFTCTDVNSLGPNPSFDSGWSTSNLYTISSGLEVGSTYTFTVKARDSLLNETVASTQASVTIVTHGLGNFITVPVPYSTIQAAIDAASDNDIVEVRPGTYTGNGNRDLDFLGKAIVVRSVNPDDSNVVAATIIDCQGNADDPHRGFAFSNGEGPNSILAGFTIKNGWQEGDPGNFPTLPGENGDSGGDASGGGIICIGGSSPTIRNCVITDCVAEGGFGGWGQDGAVNPNAEPPDPTRIDGGNGGNGGSGLGGGIYCDAASTPIIVGCEISNCLAIGGLPGLPGNGATGSVNPPLASTDGGNGGNGGSGFGGGICSASSSAIISNCRIINNNEASGWAGAPGGEGGEGATNVAPGYPGSKGEDGVALGGGAYYGNDSVINMINTTVIGSDSVVMDWNWDFVNPEFWNIPGTRGGGIYCNVDSTVTMTGCKISNNEAIRGDGGGIWYEYGGTLTLSNSTVSGNKALAASPPDPPDGYGGGIYAGNYLAPLGTNVIIDNNSIITGNTGGYSGGGLALVETNLTIDDSTISGNDAIEGAGLFAYYCMADVNSCTAKDNSGAVLGGAFSFVGGLATINNSIFTGNSADGVGGTGGAIFFEWWSDSPHKVTNCLIAGNTADFDGGGLSNNLGSWVQITNCTFVDNEVTGSGGVGGGVSCAEGQAWVEIINSILWDNFADEGPQISVGTPLGSDPYDPIAWVDVNHSDIEGGEDQVFLENTDYTNVWWMGGNFDQDPLFPSTAADEQTYFLSQVAAGQLEDSPCVDAGYGDAYDLELIVGMPLTTRTDFVADSGTVDMGYHYEAGLAVPQYQLTIEVVNQGYGAFGTVLPPWSPGTYDVNHGTVVELYAEPNEDWEVYQWTGTDYVPVYLAEPNYNTVTMNSNKTVTVEFGPHNAYKLVTHVIGNGTISYVDSNGVTVVHPGLTIHEPGTVVSLIAAPDNPSEVVIWAGTDDDYSESLNNTVTMNAHKEVYVRFYAPRTLYVPGDYPTIQAAIDDADDRDIIEISSAPQPYYTQRGFYIEGKAITITSTNPDDPCCVANTIIETDYSTPATGVGPIFFFNNVGRDTVLNGLTIRGYHASGGNGINGTECSEPGDNGGWISGGGISCGDIINPFNVYGGNASPTIKNCIISDCIIIGGDGGDGFGGCTDIPNGGDGGWPGGAYGAALACFNNSNPVVINCTFRNNVAIGGNGGDGGTGNSYVPGPGGFGGPGGGWYYGQGNRWYNHYWPNGPYGMYTEYTGRGGAVYVHENCSPVFVDCVFINNRSFGGTNGICGLDGDPYSARYEPSIHYKIDNFGGAVYVAGTGTSQFVGCEFNNNLADTNTMPASSDLFVSYGGAIAFEDGADLTFEDCTFNGNLATIGGGMYSSHSAPMINDCNFVGNSALHGGGALFVDGTVNITGSNFGENEATAVAGQGGAMCFLGVDTGIVDCSIFNNNTNGSGGGIYFSNKNVYGEDAPPALVKNCLITGNFASRDGGGISANWYSEPNIVNCTIADNRVTGAGFELGYGGGVYCSYGSYANIINSIIWDNYGNIGAKGTQLAVSTGVEYDPRPSTVNVTYSDIQDATSPNAFGAKIGALDLVFCIDATGSMEDYIEAVKEAATEITGAIKTNIPGPNSRIAVVDYKDFNQPNLDPEITEPYGGTDDYPYRTVLGFTTDANLVVAAIDTLTASGGGDWPEAVYAALMECIDHNSLATSLGGQLYGASPASLGPGEWRPGNVMRVIILMGDAQPHDPEPFTNYTLGDIVEAADVNGVEPKRIMSLLVGEDANAAGYFASLASRTGGTVLQVTGAEQVAQALLDAIDLISTVPDPIFVDVNCTLNWDPNGHIWDANSYNIDEDPCFVAGYYLSQVLAGQDVESPCVDSGSADANDPNIGLDTYTTRTDSVNDVNVVDMGYHYRLFIAPQYQLTAEAIAVPELSPGQQPVVVPDTGTYFQHTVVHLTVSPSPPPAGYQVLWTGTDDDTLTTTENTVLMNRDRSVTATFVRNVCELTASVIGVGGTVVPADGNYPRGTVVNLTAYPDEGYRVKRWTGTDDDTSYAPTNTITMNGDKYVTVEFDTPQVITVPGNYTNIQSAIGAARQYDIVKVASGVYQGGLIYIDKEITVVSTNPDDPCVVAATILDSSGYASPAVAFLPGATQSTVFDGFTLRGGEYNPIDAQEADDPGQNGFDGYSIGGGAMYVANGASPTIKNCIIRDTNITGGNASDGANADATVPAGRGGWAGGSYGGGIYIASNANPTLINCTITNCIVRGGNAGNGGNSAGEYPSEDYSDANHGGSWSNDETFPWQSLLGSNGQPYENDYWFYSGLGGGVFCAPDSSATFIACNITNNTALGGMSGIGGERPFIRPDPVTAYRIPSFGGGVFCAENADVTFTNCNIAGNTAPRPDGTYHLDPYLGHGGGIAFEQTAHVEFVNCNITDNNSAVGGGMYWRSGDPQIIDCNISDNTAYVGGGIYGTESTSLIQGCVVRGNFAGISPNDVDVNVVGQGGGIYSASMESEIIDCTVIGNEADASGGGIFFSGIEVNTPIVKNCLVIDNVVGRDGGGLSIDWYASPLITNCTIVNNAALGDFGEFGNTGFGGGIYSSYHSSSVILNSILWDNYALQGRELAVGTGFEYDPRPSTVSVSYSDVKGGPPFVFTDLGCTLIWDVDPGDPNYPTNKQADPCFVNGPLGSYYLSQIDTDDPNQTADSPCVNAGDSLASDVGLSLLYTTRTDEVVDVNLVDMGYHYPLAHPRELCSYCDLTHDGEVNLADYAVLASHWLYYNCSSADGNNWCDGADLTFDSYVNYDDADILNGCMLAADTNAPLPNPSKWKMEPYSTTTGPPYTISMTAETAYDDWGGLVEYYFECLTGNDSNSGWVPNTTYATTGHLVANVTYAYRVKARDERGHETQWSVIGYAISGQGPQEPPPPPDTDPPIPDPMTWALVPAAAGSSSITMTATTAGDDTPPVEYFFECTDHADINSGWQTGTSYTATGLTPETMYTFRVRARDSVTPQPNVTDWSDTASATTTAEVLPNLPPGVLGQPTGTMLWATTTPTPPYETGGTYDCFAHMSCQVATDPEGEGVQYYFQCVDSHYSAVWNGICGLDASGYSSGWINDPEWNICIWRPGLGLEWRVKARDTSPEMVESNWSTIRPCYPP
jgi:subtilisin family serine protease